MCIPGGGPQTIPGPAEVQGGKITKSSGPPQALTQAQFQEAINPGTSPNRRQRRGGTTQQTGSFLGGVPDAQLNLGKSFLGA